MKNKTLLLIFLLFAGGFITTQFIYEQQPRNFQPTLIQLSPADITAIHLYTPKNQYQKIEIQKSGEVWGASQHTLVTKMNPAIINRFLQQLKHIKSNGVIAKSKKEWEQLGIAPDQAVRVNIFKNKHFLESFWVAQSPSSPDHSLIRIKEQEEVYEVQQNLWDIFNCHFNDFRNHQIVDIAPQSVNKITIQLQHNTLRFVKVDHQWTQFGNPIATEKVANYLRFFRRVKGRYFADSFDELKKEEYFFASIHLTGSDFPPVQLSFFRDTTRHLPLIIHSSTNKNTFFAEPDTSKMIGDFLDFWQNPE